MSDTTATKRQMVSPQEAADMLGVHRETIYVWIKQGLLSASRLTRRVVRIRVADIEKLLAERAM